MAGTSTSEMEVLEQLKDITECCVCRETYKDPKMLPCIHTFCRTCLEGIGCNTSKSPGDRMPCPMCRTKFTIPEEGYAALQKHFFMEKLIEMAKIASPPEGSDLCEVCLEEGSDSSSDSEVPLADMYCTDCQKKLCQECSRYHINNELTRDHQVAAVADFKCKTVAPNNCIKHNRVIDLYCSDCKKLLCKSCFGGSHQNHRLQDVTNTFEGFRNEIKDILSGLKVCMSEVFEKKEILNCEVEDYCENLDILELEVCAQTDAAIKLVSEHSNLVMKDIGLLKVQKRREVKAKIEDCDGDLTCLESFKVECATVMTQGSISDICGSIDELKSRFEDIKKIHESDTEIKIDFCKTSFQTSNLEEFVKTVDFNIIGTIQECQVEAEGDDATKTASDNISHDGDKKEMEDNCRIPISGGSGILATVNHMKQELENERRRVCGLEMEKKAFEKRISELELKLGIKRPMKSTSGLSMTQPLLKQLPPPGISIDYKRSPTLVKTLYQSPDEQSIFGLTVLDDELFLGCFNVVDWYTVEAYDIRTFKLKRQWQVKHFSQSNMDVNHILCMVSCTRHKCLYSCGSIINDFAGYVSVIIQRTDVNGSNAKEWEIFPGGTCVSNLSVTGDGTIIVITYCSLIEYSRDGTLLREMKLAKSLGIEHPSHALKLASGNFVLSHGRGKDYANGVLTLSESGYIIKSFGKVPVAGVRFSQVKLVPQVYEPTLLNDPIYFTVDGFGNILVADRGNNRIVVLNSNLELESSINTTEPLQMPNYLCVDTERRRLFVCEGAKKVSVFDFSF